jgi:hypothetical protein
MRVRLTSRFDWKVPGKRAVISFQPGPSVLMTKQQAEDAIAKGVASKIKKDDDGGSRG